MHIIGSLELDWIILEIFSSCLPTTNTACVLKYCIYSWTPPGTVAPSPIWAVCASVSTSYLISQIKTMRYFVEPESFSKLPESMDAQWDIQVTEYVTLYKMMVKVLTPTLLF